MFVRRLLALLLVVSLSCPAAFGWTVFLWHYEPYDGETTFEIHRCDIYVDFAPGAPPEYGTYYLIRGVGQWDPVTITPTTVLPLKINRNWTYGANTMQIGHVYSHPFIRVTKAVSGGGEVDVPFDCPPIEFQREDVGVGPRIRNAQGLTTNPLPPPSNPVVHSVTVLIGGQPNSTTWSLTVTNECDELGQTVELVRADGRRNAVGVVSAMGVQSFSHTEAGATAVAYHWEIGGSYIPAHRIETVESGTSIIFKDGYTRTCPPKPDNDGDGIPDDEDPDDDNDGIPDSEDLSPNGPQPPPTGQEDSDGDGIPDINDDDDDGDGIPDKDDPNPRPPTNSPRYNGPSGGGSTAPPPPPPPNPYQGPGTGDSQGDAMYGPMRKAISDAFAQMQQPPMNSPSNEAPQDGNDATSERGKMDELQEESDKIANTASQAAGAMQGKLGGLADKFGALPTSFGTRSSISFGSVQIGNQTFDGTVDFGPFSNAISNGRSIILWLWTVTFLFMTVRTIRGQTAE